MSQSEEDDRIVYVLSGTLHEVHSSLIETYGGLPGVRDENALESAIGRPKNLAAYGGVSSIPELAASLSWAILRNHPFSDGNKRVAFAALVIFLNRNGWSLTCSQAEETAVTLRAAASEITEEEWTAWVHTVVKRNDCAT